MYYEQASRLLLSARSIVRGKPIGNNTRLMQREGYIAVKFHNTDIIRYYPDGKVQLFTGGWYTVTTKERINRYIGLGIYSKKGTWYVPNKTGLFNDVPIEFEEGMFV